MAHSKRYRAATGSVDTAIRYRVADAVALVKKTSTVKFDASVELHFHLGIDASKADQGVRGTVKLPHGTGKKLRIAVFANGKAADEAKKAGAALVGGEEFVKQIKEKGVTDFDIAVAAPDMMKQLSPIAKILGQRGLMPNPKNETVNPNPAAVVTDLNTGKIAFRNDTGSNVHVVVGKVSFEDQKLVENVTAMIEAVNKAKPAEAKGTYLQSVSLTSTMGPSVSVDPRSAK
ncbi:MAG: 50S ribosomal protein L1 [Candidatus Kerfeldbacteria bacterium]